jgi:hypothetical protein
MGGKDRPPKPKGITMAFTPEQRAELRELMIAAHPKLAAVLTGRDKG